MAAECVLFGCMGFLSAVPLLRAKQAWAGVAHQLGKDYAISAMIGSGAYGAVYIGAELASGDTVAVKVISRTRAKLQEVEAEAAMLRRVVHRNIVGFRKLLVGPRHACLVMDHYGGGDLVEALQKHLRQDNTMIPCDKLVHIVAQLTSAVQHLHSRGIIHRDVKGDNVMLDREDWLDPRCRIALGDFGTARPLAVDGRLSTAAGTKMFWAPEFFDMNYGVKVDIWALGVVVYSLLVCRFPFKDEGEVRRLEPAMPKCLGSACRSFLKQALRKDEAARASGNDLIAHPWVQEEVLARTAGGNSRDVFPSVGSCVSDASTECTADSFAQGGAEVDPQKLVQHALSRSWSLPTTTQSDACSSAPDASPRSMLCTSPSGTERSGSQ